MSWPEQYIRLFFFRPFYAKKWVSYRSWNYGTSSFSNSGVQSGSVPWSKMEFWKVLKKTTKLYLVWFSKTQKEQHWTDVLQISSFRKLSQSFIILTPSERRRATIKWLNEGHFNNRLFGNLIWCIVPSWQSSELIVARPIGWEVSSVFLDFYFRGAEGGVCLDFFKTLKNTGSNISRSYQGIPLENLPLKNHCKGVQHHFNLVRMW